MRYRFLRYPEGREKALTLSYDDTSIYDEKLVRIINKYGIKTTLNTNSGLFGCSEDCGHLSVQKIDELARSGGHEIAIHGENHIALGKATTVEGIRDVLLCRERAETVFDRITRGYAYADSGIRELTSGVTYAEIRQYLQALGIAYARTLGEDNCNFMLPEDFYKWIPTVHHTNQKLFDYLDKFLNAKMPSYCAERAPYLFYMWGHSAEFQRDNNWEILEKFCHKAGGRKDIWYATNIEICDYVNAYRSLQFSVDNTKVFNPTCQTIWFEMDGEMVSVPAGENVWV